MKKNSYLCVLYGVFTCLVVLVLFIPDALCQALPTLQEGIQEYQQENYEEAVEILEKVRAKEPKSTTAAFFLGVAYKQLMDYPKAAINLQDAVTVTPHVKEALVELVDVLSQMEKLEEAKKWISLAEKEGISPARVAFLKGMILSRENKNKEAIDAFEKAKKMEPTMAQVAELQIALCYMKDQKLDKAKERFQAAVLYDPLSDLAGYARHYQDMVEKGLYVTRPLRLTLGIFGGYDTNMISKPIEAAVAGDITDEKAGILTSSVRLDYIPRIEGRWMFNAQYAFNSNINQKHTHTHDSMANSFSISPGYNFGRFAVNITASYTSALLRTDPDLVPAPDSDPGYRRCMDYITYGPTFRVMLTQDSVLEIFSGYDKKEYYNQKIGNPEGDRDSVGPRFYLSWIWLFKENAFLNLKYEFNEEHADGIWGENKGDRFTANLSIPLLPDALVNRIGLVSLQMTGGAFLQNYKYEQPYVDIDGTMKSARKKDKIYNGSIGITWAFYKDANFIVQFATTKATSNVPTSEYNRSLYTAGIEYRF